METVIYLLELQENIHLKLFRQQLQQNNIVLSAILCIGITRK